MSRVAHASRVSGFSVTPKRTFFNEIFGVDVVPESVFKTLSKMVFNSGSAACRVGSKLLLRGRSLNPASNPLLIAKIFFAELSLQIAFFAHNNEAIDQDETDWHGQ
jgi:hypothetical protein